MLEEVFPGRMGVPDITEQVFGVVCLQLHYLGSKKTDVTIDLIINLDRTLYIAEVVRHLIMVT